MNCIRLATVNCYKQSGLNIAKQMQIQQFMQKLNLDVIHLQEVAVDDNTFKECTFLTLCMIFYRKTQSLAM